jgi:hypothetical protein
VLTQKRKKRGPPATGKVTLVGVRLQPNLLAALDKWAAAHNDRLGRPEADPTIARDRARPRLRRNFVYVPAQVVLPFAFYDCRL